MNEAVTTQLLTREELKPGAFYAPVGPKGEELRGTLETIPGVALASRVKAPSLKADEVEIHYDGETDVWWDGQTSDRTNDGNERRIWVDMDGNEWNESEIRFKESTV